MENELTFAIVGQTSADIHSRIDGSLPHGLPTSWAKRLSSPFDQAINARMAKSVPAFQHARASCGFIKLLIANGALQNMVRHCDHLILPESFTQNQKNANPNLYPRWRHRLPNPSPPLQGHLELMMLNIHCDARAIACPTPPPCKGRDALFIE